MLSALLHSSHCLNGVPTTLPIQRIFTQNFQKIAQILRWFEETFHGLTKFRFGCSTVSRALTIVRTYYPNILLVGSLEASTTWSQMLPRLSIFPLWAFWPLRLSDEHELELEPSYENSKKYMRVFSQHQHSEETRLCSLPKLRIVTICLFIKLCIIISSFDREPCLNRILLYKYSDTNIQIL
jgi:hypothetical protein